MPSEHDIARYLAGEMTPEERTEFENAIAGDSQGLLEFSAQRSVDAGLRYLLARDQGRVESAVMASVRSTTDEAAIERVLADTVGTRVSAKFFFSWLQIFRRRGVFWPITACAAALLVLGACLALYFGSADEGKYADGMVPAIARLTHGTAVEWESGASQEIGGGLWAGTLRLKSGSVEIEFASGARGILEGPAELRIISPMEADLAYGKFNAQVPPTAHGFSVTAGGTKVVDLGTAFGVNKPPTGSVEVHVFTGKVEVASANAQSPRELTQGEAIRMGPGGTANLPADRSEFVSEKELAEKEAVELEARFVAWEKTSTAIDADPALVVHFNFEDGAKAGTNLMNRAASAPAETQGIISGCDWVEGRWPNKRALSFTDRSARVKLKVSRPLTSATYVAWVRVEGLPRPTTALAMSQNFSRGDVRWQIAHGYLQFGISTNQPCETNNWDTVENRHMLLSRLYGQWLQLAAVYDGPGKTMAIYLNGNCVASKPVQQPVELVLNDLELGNWEPLLNRPKDYAVRRQRERPSYKFREFYGRMDEFVLLSRPLSVAGASTAGQPQSINKTKNTQ
jgi:hypothetical protein